MYFPKTGELKTFWTNYTCIDEDCPGRRHNERRNETQGDKAHPWTRAFKRDREVQAWLDDSNRDSPTYTKHSPSYWRDGGQRNDHLGFDGDGGHRESLYRS